jgi:TonB family protein
LPDAVPIAPQPKPVDLPPLIQGIGSLPKPPATTPSKPAPGVLTPAKATIYPRPIVPPEVKAMISREIEVQVSLQIDAEGRVISAEATNPDGSLARTLGRIAADTARLWRFEPGRQDGKAIASTMTIQFKFGPVKPVR